MPLSYKGAYNAGSSYNVGDVVVFTDNVAYNMVKAAPAGTTCHDTLYWCRLQPPLGDAILTIHGAITSMLSTMASDGEAITALNEILVDDKTIVLASSTEDSTKKFAITVDDDGDISATEIEEPAEENVGE